MKTNEELVQDLIDRVIDEEDEIRALRNIRGNGVIRPQERKRQAAQKAVLSRMDKLAMQGSEMLLGDLLYEERLKTMSLERGDSYDLTKYSKLYNEVLEKMNG